MRVSIKEIFVVKRMLQISLRKISLPEDIQLFSIDISVW